MLRDTVFEDKVIGAALVTVDDHQKKGLQPYEVNCGGVNDQWLSGVVQNKILGIVK